MLLFLLYVLQHRRSHHSALHVLWLSRILQCFSPSKKIISPRLALLDLDVPEAPSLLTKIRVRFPLTGDPDRIYRPILAAEDEPFPITNRVPRVHRFAAYYSCWCVCQFTTRWTLSSDPSKTPTTLVQFP